MALLIPIFLMTSSLTVRQNILGGKLRSSEIRPIIVETLLEEYHASLCSRAHGTLEDLEESALGL